MASVTGISWCHHTFNPWHGCVKVSPACTNCYAERDSRSWPHFHDGDRKPLLWGPASERRFFGDKHWNEPVRWNRAAQTAGKRRRVFCASMADVFEIHPDPVQHAEMQVARHRLWRLIDETPWLDWLLLTKRPENIRTLTPGDWDQPRPNVWLGTTAENQHFADLRIPQLLRVPAVVYFLSAEPLLGHLDISPYLPNPLWNALPSWKEPELAWVIAGGESGSEARPSHPDWFRSLRGQCANAGVPFHFKQWGEWAPGECADAAPRRTEQTATWFDGQWSFGSLTPRQSEELHADDEPDLYRLGKVAAGRTLDGREWNEFPEVRA